MIGLFDVNALIALFDPEHVKTGGRLVTFDRRIRADAVAGGSKKHLHLLGQAVEPEERPPEG